MSDGNLVMHNVAVRDDSRSDSPLVSIVMPVYNAGDTLDMALQSVLHQSYNNWELLIVDDGSTDMSWSIIESYSDSRIHRFRLPENVGRGRARNMCLARARGKYISIFDADDQSTTGRLMAQVEFLEANPDIAVVASQLRYIDCNRKEVVGFTFPTDEFAIQSRLLKGHMSVPHASATIRRELFAKYGGYSPEMLWAQDLEWFLRLAEHERFVTTSDKLVNYRTKKDATGFRSWRTSQLYRRYAAYRGECQRRGIESKSLSHYQNENPFRQSFLILFDAIRYGLWRFKLAVQGYGGSIGRLSDSGRQR